MQRMPRSARAMGVLAVAAAATIACRSTTTTTLDVKRQLDGSLEPGQGAGVPYQLTRPNFRLTETLATPDNPVTRYTLAVGWQADPDQRYTLAVDAASFTESDLKLTFGEHGNLTLMNAKARDQIVPTITAVGEFLIQAAAVVATQGAALPVTAAAALPLATGSFASDPEASLTLSQDDVEPDEWRMILGRLMLVGEDQQALSPCFEPVKDPSKVEPIHHRWIRRIDEKGQIWVPSDEPFASREDGDWTNPTTPQCDVLRLLRRRIEDYPTASLLEGSYYDLVGDERLWIGTVNRIVDLEGLPNDLPAEAETVCGKKDGCTPDISIACSNYLATRRQYFASGSEIGDEASIKKWRESFHNRVRTGFMSDDSAWRDFEAAAALPGGLLSEPSQRLLQAKRVLVVADQPLLSDQEWARLKQAFRSGDPKALDAERRRNLARRCSNPKRWMSLERRERKRDCQELRTWFEGRHEDLAKLDAALFEYDKQIRDPLSLASLPAEIERALAAADGKAFMELERRVRETGSTSGAALLESARPLLLAEIDRTITNSVVDLPVVEWRRRHILFLEAKIAAVQRQRAQLDSVTVRRPGNASTTYEAKADELEEMLDELEREWHRTVDAEGEYAAKQRLEAVLAEVAAAETRNPAAARPDVAGFTDYELARKELDAVLAAIAVKRSRLKKNNPTPPPSREITPLMLVYRGPGKSTPEFVQECVKAGSRALYSKCGSAAWSYDVPPAAPREGEEPPEFVLVIDKGEG